MHQSAPVRSCIGAFVHLCIGAFLHFGCGGSIPAKPRPNVLLITIDTFRADRLGIGVTPALDRLAASSVRFTAARSAVPLTLPSHTTILTGLMPPQHGVRENGVDSLSDAHKTIATALKTVGYQTAAFVGAFVLDRRFGLSQGFDTYDDRIPRDPSATDRLEAERPASAVVTSALAWLDRSIPPPHPAQPVATSPWFMWIHLYDPHAPYDPPREFIRIPNPESRIPTTTDRYDGELRYADAEIQRVFDWLRQHQLLDQTLIVVAGDHGEGLGDHGEATHGMLLFESTLRVPLVIVAPGTPPAVRGEAVTLAEIAPTILSAASAVLPSEMKGRDLLDVRPPPSQRAASVPSTSVPAGWDGGGNLYAETEYPRVAGWSPLQALTDGRWKTIRAGALTEVYDLQNDPRELRDVAEAQKSVAAAMSARIDVVGSTASSSTREISPDAAERLRALGYVASSPAQRVAGSSVNPAGRIDSWNQFEQALSSLSAHRAAAALPILKALAASNPDAPVFRVTYARALQESGNLTGALDAYRQAARKWPTDAPLLHDLAVAAREAAGRSSGATARSLQDEAQRADRAAIVVAPKSAMAHNGLGLLAIDRNQAQEAAKEFDAAAAADPNNASYWVNLGNARRALHDAAAAEQAYRRALEVDPRAADAANGLGVLLVETQHAADAVTWFERATIAAPDFVEARLNLGIALQQSGQTARAADTYRQVIGAPGNHPREREAASRLLASLGAR
jgi:arylsulfatase A-like enzyme/Tfp pilus assembly protein PilF